MAFALALACLALALALPGLSGCRASDALTEVIYDQTSQNIDYENENKYLLNDSSADIKDERVPSSEVDKRGRVTEEKQNIVVYSSNPTAPQFTAKKSAWSKDPDFTGIEASEKVRFYESDDPEATEQDIQTPPEEEEDEEDEPEQKTERVSSSGRNADEGSGGVGDAADAGKNAAAQGEMPTGQQSETGGGNGNQDGFQEINVPGTDDDGPDEDPVAPEKGTLDDVGDAPAAIQDGSGSFTEPPQVDKIAAFGQLAVVVQMVGGQGALAGADAELLSGDFSAVFADEGASDIVSVWSDDGSPEGLDVDKLEESGAQVLIVDSPGYTERLSAQQNKKLNALLKKGQEGKGGLQQVLSFDLSNTSNLKSCVKKIAKSLSESTAIGQSGNTEQIAADYISFHEGLVSECAANNGGLAYDAMSEDEPKVYELGNNRGKLGTGEQLSFNAEPKFTLLLDRWDSSVRYVGGDWAPAMTGVALSYVGYSHSPVSYYLQAGGLVNNAAARGDSSNPGLYAVWQFSTMLPMLKNPAYVEYATGGDFDNSVTPTKSRGGTSWDSALLATSYNLSAAQGSSAGSSFGSTLFPKLIAATQSIKREMIDNSDGPEDVYHPYEAAGDDVRGMRGYVSTDGSSVYFSCIGSPGSASGVERTIGSSITDADIVVNPHGLFCSWTEYGSVEGVLEAAWANDVVNEGSPALGDGGWQARVSQFYSKFYRYDSVDLAVIEAGSVE